MNTVKDLVCGMRVDPRTTPHRVRHGEHEHYFCSAECAAKFAADPGKYGHPMNDAHEKPHHEEPVAKEVPSSPAGSYTCPMHPEVRQAGP